MSACAGRLASTFSARPAAEKVLASVAVPLPRDRPRPSRWSVSSRELRSPAPRRTISPSTVALPQRSIGSVAPPAGTRMAMAADRTPSIGSIRSVMPLVNW